MDKSINIKLLGGEDFRYTPVQWHEKYQVLEFGDAPYNFYDFLDNYYQTGTEEGEEKKNAMLEVFYNSLHKLIAENGIECQKVYTIKADGLSFEVFIF